MYRNFALTLLSLLVPLTILISQDNQLAPVNFMPSWVPQPQFAGYYVAQKKGFYREVGLEVNIINGGYNKDVAKMLESGEINFGTLYLTSAIEENDHGNHLINIGQIFQKSGLIFVTKTSSGIKSLADFNGKRIAIWRTVFESTTTGFLLKHHIQADIFRVNEGVNLFLKGGVDVCAGMSYNEYNSLINYGINPNELTVFDFNKYGMGFPEDGIYCTAETFKNNPNVCSAFVKASLRGWEYALNHPEETLAILKPIQEQVNVSINIVHSNWMLKSMEEMIYPAGKNVTLGYLTPADFDSAVTFLYQFEHIRTKPKYSDFYKDLR